MYMSVSDPWRTFPVYVWINLRCIKQTNQLPLANGAVQMGQHFLVVPSLTHIYLASFLWDIGKQNSPRCDAAKRGVPSGAILIAEIIFIEKLNKNEKLLLMSLKMKVASSK